MAEEQARLTWAGKLVSILLIAGLIGVGTRLAEVPTITGHPFISPYEDLKLK